MRLVHPEACLLSRKEVFSDQSSAVTWNQVVEKSWIKERKRYETGSMSSNMTLLKRLPQESNGLG